MPYIAKPTVFTLGAVSWVDHVSGVTLSGGEDVIDARTFGAPRATTTGGGMDSVTLHLSWSDTAAALFLTIDGTDVAMVLTVDGGTWAGTVHIPDAPPAPAFTIGEKVEVDLVLGVTDALVYTAAP